MRLAVGAPGRAFTHRDFRMLFGVNIFEFCGVTLFKLAALQWLYEATSSALVLGGLGVVTLIAQIPSTLYGGVLADAVDRKALVATMMMVCAFTSALLAILCAAGALHPAIIYVAIAVVTIARRLEGSARSALLAVVVPADDAPRAISIAVLTQQAGDMLAPLLFAAVGSGFASLAPSFGVAAAAYAPAGALALAIKAPGRAAAKAGGGGLGPAAAARSLVEGVRYIFGHPLLPGLYALDWAMTLFTFYRELFPLFVDRLFVESHGLSPRAAAALLTTFNHGGGVAGSAVTLRLTTKFKGRAVCIATLAYGIAVVLYGATPWLAWGLFAVALCGGTDAVGVTMRKSVVLLTTPDELRGRASSGHSLAANLANSLGQVYVSAMAGAIGPGPTEILGGVLTWLSVALAVYKLPKAWRASDEEAAATAAAAAATAEAKIGSVDGLAAADSAAAPETQELPAAVEDAEGGGAAKLHDMDE